MLGIDWLSQSETASEAACCTYTLCIRGSAPVTSIQLLNPSADHVYMREGKELDENVQESNPLYLGGFLPGNISQWDTFPGKKRMKDLLVPHGRNLVMLHT